MQVHSPNGPNSWFWAKLKPACCLHVLGPTTAAFPGALERKMDLKHSSWDFSQSSGIVRILGSDLTYYNVMLAPEFFPSSHPSYWIRTSLLGLHYLPVKCLVFNQTQTHWTSTLPHGNGLQFRPEPLSLALRVGSTCLGFSWDRKHLDYVPAVRKPQESGIPCD